MGGYTLAYPPPEGKGYRYIRSGGAANRGKDNAPTYATSAPKLTPKQHLWGIGKRLGPIHVPGLDPGEGWCSGLMPPPNYTQLQWSQALLPQNISEAHTRCRWLECLGSLRPNPGDQFPA